MPARATTVLLEQLRAGGVTITPRQLEDWGRVGLVPRPVRRSLGRGNGTITVFPPDMADRCVPVASLMRRGVPWQQVALLLFARGHELADGTIRAAYQWAYDYTIAEDSDVLDVAEGMVTEMLHTRAGRRLERVVARYVKRSGLFADESPSALAQSVLTNMMLVPIGGDFAGDDAVVEMLAGFGAPVDELGDVQRTEAAQLIAALLARCSFDELSAGIEDMAVEELSEALSECKKAFSLLRPELRNAIPAQLVELLTALLAPFVVQIRKVAQV